MTKKIIKEAFKVNRAFFDFGKTNKEIDALEKKYKREKEKLLTKLKWQDAYLQKLHTRYMRILNKDLG